MERSELVVWIRLGTVSPTAGGLLLYVSAAVPQPILGLMPDVGRRCLSLVACFTRRGILGV
jgi:hypothetical protein